MSKLIWCQNNYVNASSRSQKPWTYEYNCSEVDVLLEQLDISIHINVFE